MAWAQVEASHEPHLTSRDIPRCFLRHPRKPKAEATSRDAIWESHQIVPRSSKPAIAYNSAISSRVLPVQQFHKQWPRKEWAGQRPTLTLSFPSASLHDRLGLAWCLLMWCDMRECRRPLSITFSLSFRDSSSWTQCTTSHTQLVGLATRSLFEVLYDDTIASGGISV
jgi:hypothetical protein